MEMTVTEGNGKKTIVKFKTADIGQTIKFNCSSCNRQTNQKKLWEREIEDPYDEQFGSFLSTIYELYICQGCDIITFRTIGLSSDAWDEDKEGEGKFRSIAP